MTRQVKQIVERAKKLKIPLTVPTKMHKDYRAHYLDATRSSGRLFLFAGDQKIEHLNQDFYGTGIPEASNDPEHLFKIADQAKIGVFASQLGLIARYGSKYNNVRYLIKLNGKTNLIPIEEKDPCSLAFTSVEQVAEFKKTSKLNVVGVGYTLYIGSQYEHEMMREAAYCINQAHSLGLVAVIWAYPRGKFVSSERDSDIIAGAAGVAACLGADFVKVNVPEGKNSFDQAEALTQAVIAAGETKVICSGGKLIEEEDFLASLYHQIHVGGSRGVAVGRNVHQKELQKAVNFCNAIAAIIYDDASFDQAKNFLL